VTTTKPTANARKVRVLIADDHLIVRVGLRALLDIHPGIEVIAEAGTGADTLRLTITHQPDVLLLDLRMPDVDGLEVCRRLKLEPPSPSVLFLTSYADDQTILAAIEAGADGYLLKAMAGQDIPSAILTVARGGSVLDPVVTRRVLNSVQRPKPAEQTAGPHSAFETLTTQETRVLELTALGKSNKQIAQELRLSEGTVRNYLSTVFAKLGVESRVEAALLWLRQPKG
jgi:two-component system, NarL family, response regulator DevR